jgi:hypothetical protein
VVAAAVEDKISRQDSATIHRRTTTNNNATTTISNSAMVIHQDSRTRDPRRPKQAIRVTAPNSKATTLQVATNNGKLSAEGSTISEEGMEEANSPVVAAINDTIPQARISSSHDSAKNKISRPAHPATAMAEVTVAINQLDGRFLMECKTLTRKSFINENSDSKGKIYRIN